mgnify:CR=1 FL=1
MQVQKPADGRPIYLQLAERMRAEIDAGRWAANGPLPPERELAALYDVSRETLRKSVKLLERDGLIFSEQGRGTFVAPSQVRDMVRYLDGFSVDTGKKGASAGQQVLLVHQAPASIAISGVLNVDPRTMLTRVKRLRTVDGVVMGMQDSYLVLPGAFSADALIEAGSLYALLADRFQIQAVEGLETLGAVAAGEEDARLLQVPEGSPLLLCERITLSQRRQPFEYCEMKYVPAYRYTARVNRGPAG